MDLAGTEPPGPEMVNGFSARDLNRQPARARELITRRAGALGPGYQLFYTDPVEVRRGLGVHLYDADGREYLDAYNNVASVGHCHPAVVDAVTRQLSTVNTNTRYLQERLLDYAEALLSTYPAGLDRVTFTCTGSEANDLAIRIARHHTGREGVIVTGNAYHGVTATVAELSPSLGRTSPLGRHVRTVSPPSRALAGARGVAEFMRREVRAAIDDLARHGMGLCAFIADSIFSSDGVFPDPVPVLDAIAEEVHRAGGLYIADEVQAGFGRTGTHWWGFERHGFRPDLVTIGKPMGNGIPIAATVLREEVGREFGETVRYFNTFGGSSVPIAAAQAVLDVIRDEDLMANAQAIGERLRTGLTEISARHPSLTEVRGAGLFLGVEVSADPGTRAPSGALAQRFVDDLRQHFVLLSASGPAGNVLKIRPPLVFGAADADRLLEEFEATAARVLHD
jgi:4-aminobutyrate aminotransferase-like enzyme